MKCPKCGYLGFDDVDRCRNCGYVYGVTLPFPENLPLCGHEGCPQGLIIRPMDDDDFAVWVVAAASHKWWFFKWDNAVAMARKQLTETPVTIVLREQRIHKTIQLEESITKLTLASPGDSLIEKF